LYRNGPTSSIRSGPPRFSNSTPTLAMPSFSKREAERNARLPRPANSTQPPGQGAGQPIRSAPAPDAIPGPPHRTFPGGCGAPPQRPAGGRRLCPAPGDPRRPAGTAGPLARPPWRRAGAGPTAQPGVNRQPNRPDNRPGAAGKAASFQFC
jgi:hypothetical protein